MTFYVEAGPNVGRTGTAVTNASGVAAFTHTGSGGVGTDTVSGVFNEPAADGASSVSGVFSKRAPVGTGPQEKNFAQVVWAAAVVASPSPVGLPKAGDGSSGRHDPMPLLAVLAGGAAVMTLAVSRRLARATRHRGGSA